MSAKAAEVQIPEPPQIKLVGHPGIPESIRDAWRSTYAHEYGRGLTLAINEFKAGNNVPVDPEKCAAYCLSHIRRETLSDLHQAARIEANKVLSVTAPRSYAEAMALPDWQLLRREKRADDATGGSRLFGVTIDGKKFSFPVPTGQTTGQSARAAS